MTLEERQEQLLMDRIREALESHEDNVDEAADDFNNINNNF